MEQLPYFTLVLGEVGPVVSLPKECPKRELVLNTFKYIVQITNCILLTQSYDKSLYTNKN